jgi:hypothetical protein
MTNAIKQIVSEVSAGAPLTLAIRRADAQCAAFALGWRHGNVTRLHCSRREAETYFADVRPDWGSAEMDLYLNGRDDGVRGDRFRLDRVSE